jgi:FkbM family methyltransferase
VYERTWQSFRTPRGRPVEMVIRAGTNDWNTTNACMTEDEYGLRDLSFSTLAVDVGGYTGGVSIGLAVDNPGLRVLCIEPVPANQELIRENIARAGVGEQVLLYPGAAAGRTVETTTIRHSYRGDAALEHHAFVGNTSLVYERAGIEEHDETEVYCLSLTVIVAAYGVPEFLKIDCEGCEYSFLDDPATRQVPLIIGEWHPVPWSGRGMTRDDIRSLLPFHDVAFSGPESGPGGFRAVLR